jgi:NTE family protein
MWWDHRDTSETAPEAAPVEPAPARESPASRIGLALGGGAARGWAHIGVMRTLIDAGLEPRIMAGTSIGALVAGCYAAGKLDELEEFALSLTKRRVLGLLDVHLGGSGLIGGDRLRRLLETHLSDITIEELPLRFAAIATEFGSGHEVWLRNGPLIDAMRASYALPGVLDPVRIGGRWLMDGALVNPIPVTAARALGAETVICVNLNGEIRSRGTTIQTYVPHEEAVAAARDLVTAGLPVANVMAEGMRGAAQRLRNFVSRPNGAPGLAAVMVEAFNITQDRIARSRLAGDPPDLMIAPRLGRIGLFEFHRAAESIALGREAAQRALPDLMSFIETAPAPI